MHCSFEHFFSEYEPLTCKISAYLFRKRSISMRRERPIKHNFFKSYHRFLGRLDGTISFSYVTPWKSLDTMHCFQYTRSCFGMNRMTRDAPSRPRPTLQVHRLKKSNAQRLYTPCHVSLEISSISESRQTPREGTLAHGRNCSPHWYQHARLKVPIIQAFPRNCSVHPT